MALLQVQFFSEVLGLSSSMNVILPEQTHTQIGMENQLHTTKHKTLYLLHGYSDDHSIWLRRTSIERYVAATGIAVVMPAVDHSYYTDMEYGKKYWTFVSDELPQIARSFFHLSDKREDNFVAGLSMGGYGAFKLALNHPDRFAAAASLSGALDIRSRTLADAGRKFDLILGGKDPQGTSADLFHLIDKHKNNPNRPLLYQSCGTEDFLYEDNQRFTAHCQKSGYELTTDYGPGDHNWEYWDDQIQAVLKWLPIHS
ncbi:alpha/beta hydrolase [Alkalihalobacillus pseudalcaliphilus]|uniref:alpha/beta hydrolase n=1 Tax=Alkalihalobacillus pseudalcaliphilus TaxID=79884 RepID=UPI00064DA187|nr:alpha/beta hydrolase family protein [Alkalihalobacillus pseudalcaliphilus]KMK75504.1 esterase [Alkalihalobacillus pseudalcaliphilus]